MAGLTQHQPALSAVIAAISDIRQKDLFWQKAPSGLTQFFA